jgi:3-deoxy-D-manno-octulosonate 8-phosphate phosphatase (KDO 8-P phosphatase)
MQDLQKKIHKITTFIFDYDGVLTDGKVILTNDGEALRSANVKDGYALQYAIKMGYRVAVISGGRSKAILKRFSTLNVTDIFMGVEDKMVEFEKYIRKNKLSAAEVLFMGDDLPDYPLMQAVGISCCPADASAEISEVASYVCKSKGGEGCAREVIEHVLRLQKKWFNKNIAFHW